MNLIKSVRLNLMFSLILSSAWSIGSLNDAFSKELHDPCSAMSGFHHYSLKQLETQLNLHVEPDQCLRTIQYQLVLDQIMKLQVIQEGYAIATVEAKVTKHGTGKIQLVSDLRITRLDPLYISTPLQDIYSIVVAQLRESLPYLRSIKFSLDANESIPQSIKLNQFLSTATQQNAAFLEAMPSMTQAGVSLENITFDQKGTDEVIIDLDFPEKAIPKSEPFETFAPKPIFSGTQSTKNAYGITESTQQGLLSYQDSSGRMYGVENFSFISEGHIQYDSKFDFKIFNSNQKLISSSPVQYKVRGTHNKIRVEGISFNVDVQYGSVSAQISDLALFFKLSVPATHHIEFQLNRSEVPELQKYFENEDGAGLLNDPLFKDLKDKKGVEIDITEGSDKEFMMTVSFH
jgi:hypothetical protein